MNLLIQFAHPALQKSRVHKRLLDHIPEAVKVNDLYERYPHFHLNIKEERALLEQADVIIFQHPVYWYSVPPLLKHWFDIMLRYGYAFGPGGEALKGKYWLHLVTTGGSERAYGPEGSHRFSLMEFFRPFEQSAQLCQMTYLPPWAIFGTHQFGSEEIEAWQQRYHEFLTRLSEGAIPLTDLHPNRLLNHQIS